jgi:membrane protease YdiL (CAAX protease family)
MQALAEVVLCSGLPTQLVIGQLLGVAGYPPFADGAPQRGPLAALALLDSVILIGLILLLLRVHGESAAELLVGRRPVLRESLLGLLLVPAFFVGVGVVVLTLRALLPWTHNVPINPFEQLMRTPGDAALFAVVVIVAGGLREEIQRAFLLRRFEVHLGGQVFGLIVVSLGFGLGHALQGWDAAIVTGLLGYTWGVLYLKRRSAVAPIVSHSGYNALQVLQVLLLRDLHLPG